MTIQQLYILFRSDPEYSLEAAQAFFVKYGDSIDQIKTFENSESFNQYIELSWQWLHVLYQTYYYRETLQKSTQVLTFIESETQNLKMEPEKREWFQGIIFFQGMASHELNKYKTAMGIFKKLIRSDPDNENYKLWLNHSRYNRNRWISGIVTMSSALLLAISMLLRQYKLSFTLQLILEMLALLGFAGSLLFDFLAKKKFKANDGLADNI